MYSCGNPWFKKDSFSSAGFLRISAMAIIHTPLTLRCKEAAGAHSCHKTAVRLYHVSRWLKPSNHPPPPKNKNYIMWNYANQITFRIFDKKQQ